MAGILAKDVVFLTGPVRGRTRGAEFPLPVPPPVTTPSFAIAGRRTLRAAVRTSLRRVWAALATSRSPIRRGGGRGSPPGIARTVASQVFELRRPDEVTIADALRPAFNEAMRRRILTGQHEALSAELKALSAAYVENIQQFLRTESRVRVIVVGSPHVGKSTLLGKLLEMPPEPGAPPAAANNELVTKMEGHPALHGRTFLPALLRESSSTSVPVEIVWGDRRRVTLTYVSEKDLERLQQRARDFKALTPAQVKERSVTSFEHLEMLTVWGYGPGETQKFYADPLQDIPPYFVECVKKREIAAEFADDVALRMFLAAHTTHWRNPKQQCWSCWALLSKVVVQYPNPLLKRFVFLDHPGLSHGDVFRYHVAVQALKWYQADVLMYITSYSYATNDLFQGLEEANWLPRLNNPGGCPLPLMVCYPLDRNKLEDFKQLKEIMTEEELLGEVKKTCDKQFETVEAQWRSWTKNGSVLLLWPCLRPHRPRAACHPLS